MPRDYVKSRPRRRQERSGSSGVIWLLMGVLIGLIIAFVFYVKNQNHSKPLVLPEFSQKTAEQPSTITTTTEVSSSQQQPQHIVNNKTPAKPPSTQNLQTQFDFYNVLPSQKVIGPSGDEDTAEIQKPETQTSPPQQTAAVTPPTQEEIPAVPAATSAKPETKTQSTQKKLPPVIQAVPSLKPKTPVASAATEKSSTYTVQVAALSDSSDADQLKAQLTLLGFDVKVSTTDKNGKTYHRVWLGPFHTTKEAESIQKQLQENMISAKVLKSGT